MSRASPRANTELRKRKRVSVCFHAIGRGHASSVGKKKNRDCLSKKLLSNPKLRMWTLNIWISIWGYQNRQIYFLSRIIWDVWSPSLFTNTILWDVPVNILRSCPEYMNFRTNQIRWGPSAFVFIPGNKIRPKWIDPELSFTNLQYKQCHPVSDLCDTLNHTIFLNCIREFTWLWGKALTMKAFEGVGGWRFLFWCIFIKKTWI